MIKRRSMTRKRSASDKKAHHVWSAEADERGVPVVRREKLEKEAFDGITASRRSASSGPLARKVAAEKCAAYLGLFGADLVDNPTLVSAIPAGVVRRFNAATRNEASPRIYTWNELRKAFNAEHVDHARKAIADGIKVRLASKYLDLPFVITADVLDQISDLPREAIKCAVDHIKTGANVLVDKVALSRVANVLSTYTGSGSYKMAADNTAQSYWENYYGPYGKELVKEVKKRVRADLAHKWLHKNGVDSAAAEYWKGYFGAYGDEWVTIVPKRLSPSNVR